VGELRGGFDYNGQQQEYNQVSSLSQEDNAAAINSEWASPGLPKDRPHNEITLPCSVRGRISGGWQI
jgi:hypothetical protein